MKKTRLNDIKSLYLNFYLNKASITILSLSYLLLIIIFFINSNLPMNEQKYLSDSKFYLDYYFKNNLMIINIINKVLFVIIGTLEITTNSINFDSLFISKIGRNKLILIKIYNYIKIVVIYTFFEFLLLLLIPIIVYPTFSFEIEFLGIYVSYMLIDIYLVLFTVLLVYIINNYFVSFVMFSYLIMTDILKNSTKELYRVISGFLFPDINYINWYKITISNGYIYIITLIFFLITCIMIVYRHRNIKIN